MELVRNMYNFNEVFFPSRILVYHFFSVASFPEASLSNIFLINVASVPFILCAELIRNVYYNEAFPSNTT